MLFDSNGNLSQGIYALLLNAIPYTSGKAKAKGYLEVGKDKRHFRHAYTRESFFGIGMNLPEIQQTNWAYKHAGYKSRRDDIFTSFHNNGGNFARILAFDDLNGVDNITVRKIAPASGPCPAPDGTNFNEIWIPGDPNQYQLGNYQMNQMHMWETDLDIKQCEELDIFLIYCMQIHYPFSITPTRAYYEGWETNAYRRELNLSANVKDYFVNEEARRFFRNKLRYMQARWGYSTAVAVWQLASEIDQYGQTHATVDLMGTPCPADDVYDVILKPWAADSPIFDENFLEALENWHCSMADYLMFIQPRKIITTGYIGNPFENNQTDNGSNQGACIDQSFLCGNIDIVTLNVYFGPNPDHNKFQNFGRNSIFGSASNYIYQPDNYSCTGGNPGYYVNKPYIITETAAGPGWKCCDLDFHNKLWQSLCSGHACTALDWGPDNIQFSHIPDYFPNFNAVKQFTQTINFENNVYVPAFNDPCQLINADGNIDNCPPNGLLEDIEVFMMKNFNSNGPSTSVFGWVHSRMAITNTVAYTVANGICLPYAEPYLAYNQCVPIDTYDKLFKVDGFLPGAYYIQVFDTRSGVVIGTIEEPNSAIFATPPFNHLNLRIPAISLDGFTASNWSNNNNLRTDYAFKFWHESVYPLRKANNLSHSSTDTLKSKSTETALQGSNIELNSFDKNNCFVLSYKTTNHIQITSSANHITLWSVSGKKIREHSLNSETTINTDELSPGIYILAAHGPEGQIVCTKKISVYE